jgi:hypothetical protein
VGWRRLCYGDGYITTFIVYGLITNPETVIKGLVANSLMHNEHLTSNLAVVTDGTPSFRLNSHGWMDFKNVGPINITSTVTMFEIIREKIRSKISPFSKIVNEFIHDYLNYIETQITHIPNSKDELFEQYDWIFSGWLPLTHAHILINVPNDNEPVEFAEFDLCYWTGRKILCINLGSSSSIIQSKKRKIDYLKKSNPLVEIITIPKNIILEKEKKFPSEFFDTDFKEFWNGLKIPLGPNQPPVLSQYFSDQSIK